MSPRLNPEAKSWQYPIIIPRARGILQRKCACGNQAVADGECTSCSKQRMTLQRHSVGNQTQRTEVPPIVNEVLHSSGQPLDARTRAFMEPRFGHDFSHVRVHTDTKAAESARAVNALAYTVGRSMVFGSGQYQPHIYEGRGLLAHELTHVMQQGEKTPLDGSAGRQMLFDETAAGQVAEIEADQFAADATATPRWRPIVTEMHTPALQRRTSGSPDVQVRSPVFEETVTQLSDIAGATSGRPLSIAERALAFRIFGRSIDYARVRLITLDALEYRTVGNNIYIPRNFTIANAEIAQTLIHELTHVWQYQHGGTSYISISLSSQIAAGIGRGNRNFAYDYQLAGGESFFDFSPEQQGSIVENYFAMRRDQSAIPQDVAAGVAGTYQSNHLDSTGFRAQLSASDRQAEISTELPLHEPLIRQMQTALPQPEANILLSRASEVMTSPGRDLLSVPPERQLVPVRPLFEVRF